MINVRSVADLNRAIFQNLHRIDRRAYDVIVGIPRSGMIPASLLSTHLQLPLSDVESFARGYLFGRSGAVVGVRADQKLRVLLVDDSSNKGGAMKKAVARIGGIAGSITRLAVYGPYRDDLSIIDIFLEECNGPRAFQWNLAKHARLRRWFFDMDGVLCRDPTKAENDDGDRYRHFLLNAEPVWIPLRPIGHIITCRLEKYRAETEAWLHRHRIEYAGLHMMQHATKEDRMAAGGRGQWKAQIAADLSAIDDTAKRMPELFIESDRKQAKIIAARLGCPVWCTSIQEVVHAAS